MDWHAADARLTEATTIVNRESMVCIAVFYAETQTKTKWT